MGDLETHRFPEGTMPMYVDATNKNCNESRNGSPSLFHGAVLHLLYTEVPENTVPGDGTKGGNGQRGTDSDGGRLVPESESGVAVEDWPEVGALVHEGLQLEGPQEDLAVDPEGIALVLGQGQVDYRLAARERAAHGGREQHFPVGQLDGFS